MAVSEKPKDEKRSSGILHYIYTYLLLLFFFFGFIANTGNAYRQQHPSNKLLFLYTMFVNFRPEDHLDVLGLYLPHTIQNIVTIFPAAFSLIILILIGINQGYREDFLIQSVKKAFWTVPGIIGISWVLFAVTYRMNFLLVLSNYFLNIHGYLNIVTLFLIYVLSGFFGGYLKIKKYRKKHRLQLYRAGLLTERERKHVLLDFEEDRSVSSVQ
ncbi:MAG: hypothetical protein ACTSWL_01115 [Promethearchaeota archaeon]